MKLLLLSIVLMMSIVMVSAGTGDLTVSLTDPDFTTEIFILNTNHSNSTDNWVTNNNRTLSGINITQMENNGGILSIVTSWFSSFFDTLFGAKDTDDLSQGSTNLYQNKSFNQSLTDTLYYDITDNVLGYYNSTDFSIADYYLKSNPFNFYNSTNPQPGANSSWNETHANTLYYIQSSVDTNITTANTSMKIYVDAQDISVNTTMKTYVDAQDIIFNDSSTVYTDSKLITTFFNASSIQTVTGTPSGTIGLLHIYDGISYNVTEVSSDMELRANFTGITDFNQLIFRYKSSTTESHNLVLHLWDYENLEWESYKTIGNTEGEYVIETVTVFDTDEHLSGGLVQLRFYSNNIGGSTHLHQFDWVSISNGPATPSSDETDPFAIHKDGMVSFEDNWDQGDFNFTNLNSWFLGKINYSSIQNHPSIQGDNSSWNETHANTLYYDISDNVLSYWNDTFAGFNKTYADTLYAPKVVPASTITAGTFGTGNYVMDTNLTVEKLVFETDPKHFINDNATCSIIRGDTSIFEVC